MAWRSASGLRGFFVLGRGQSRYLHCEFALPTALLKKSVVQEIERLGRPRDTNNKQQMHILKLRTSRIPGPRRANLEFS